MDLIAEPIRRTGRFTRTRPPAKYVSIDAIGFFQGDGPPQAVDVTFSKAVGASAASREWQTTQQVSYNRDGTVTITLTVDDVGELVRWALGFGEDAWISSPRSSVSNARKLLANITRLYQP
jgi:predicted DNA-binding transcriptional regulator YafY